jgi:HK97 family phage major capsid protein
MSIPAITRDRAEAALARQESYEIIELATRESAVLAAGNVIPMRGETIRVPVVGGLPVASFVGESTGGQLSSEGVDVKPKSSAQVDTLLLKARTLATIIVVPEEVLEDDEAGLTAMIQQRAAEAIGAKLDEAVLFGTPDKPVDWPTSLVPAAIAKGRFVVEGTGVDLAADINAAWGEVEDSDFDINVQMASRRIRARLRGLRDDQNAPIFVTSLRDDAQAESVYGEPIYFVRNGAWDNSEATLLVGDARHLHIGLRSDVSYKLLTEAPVTDSDGNVYSLAERDLVAVRARFRAAYEVSIPVSRDQSATPFPFAAVVPSGS